MNLTWLYVGAIFALAVFLGRRAGARLPRSVAFVFYALVLLFFFDPLTRDSINIPTDVVRRVGPWAHIDQRPPLNHEMNDVAMQHAIWAHQVRESWRNLTPPLWNHLSGSGYPLLANGQSSALSPFRILALPLPLGNAMTAEAAMKILIALTFMFLFCQRRGLSTWASVTASVAFGFGGFMAIWIHFPHTTAACFLPAVLYLVDVMAERPSYRAFVGSAVVWALVLFAGHPETAAHIFFLALLYVLWIVGVEKAASWRLLLPLGGALAVAALLAAPFLLPFVEAVTRSQRYDWLKVTPFRAAELPWKNWQSATTLLQPHLWGRVPVERTWGWSVAEPMSGFAGTLAVAAWFATVFSVVRRRTWRSREMFFACATLLVLGVVFAWPLIGEGIHLILPLVAHARFRLLFVFLVAIQSAYAIDRSLRGERWPLAVGLVAVLLLNVMLFATISFPDPGKLRSGLIAAVPSAIVIALAALLVVRKKTWATYALFAAVTFEMFSMMRGWSPATPAKELYPTTPLIAKLIELKNGTPSNQPFRVAGLDAQLFPNTSSMFGIEDIRAHDPMAYARYLGFLRMTSDYDPWEYFARLRYPDHPVYDFLNVRYLILNPQRDLVDPRYQLIYEGPDGRIFENKHVLPRFFAVRNVLLEFRAPVFYPQLAKHRDWGSTVLLDDLEIENEAVRGDLFNPRPEESAPAHAQIVSAEPADFRLHVTAPRWSLVASSIPWWPGWKVERNGEPISPIRVNATFLGFAVPPGESNVRVWYSPWTWWAGVWIAFSTASVLVLGGRLRQFAGSRGNKRRRSG